MIRMYSMKLQIIDTNNTDYNKIHLVDHFITYEFSSDSAASLFLIESWLVDVFKKKCSRTQFYFLSQN